MIFETFKISMNNLKSQFVPYHQGCLLTTVVIRPSKNIVKIINFVTNDAIFFFHVKSINCKILNDYCICI